MVKQLNSCKAFYDYNFLQSYCEVVAFYDNKHNVYYLYRYNSVTTRQHFYKWFKKREEGGCNEIFIKMYKFAKDYGFLHVKAVIDQNGLIIPQKCTPFEYYNTLISEVDEL